MIKVKFVIIQTFFVQDKILIFWHQFVNLVNETALFFNNIEARSPTQVYLNRYTLKNSHMMPRFYRSRKFIQQDFFHNLCESDYIQGKHKDFDILR